MSAAPKLKLRFRDGSELMFLLLLHRHLSKFVESQTVEGVRIRIDIGVEVDCISRGERECAGCYKCAIRERDGLEGFSLERGC